MCYNPYSKERCNSSSLCVGMFMHLVCGFKETLKDAKLSFFKIREMDIKLDLFNIDFDLKLFSFFLCSLLLSGSHMIAKLKNDIVK